MSAWSLALGGSESKVDRNRIDFRIRPSHPIWVEWSWQNHLPTHPARSVLLSALPSVLREVPLKMELVVGVVELGALSWAPEGQGVEVAVGVLAVEARSRRPMQDVGTGFVVVKPM